jgi:hypothetical protein
MNTTDIVSRSQNEEEIKQLIECVMKNRPYLTFEDFKEITLNLTSDWFLIVLNII